jgi:thymidylate synthase (FAD)
MTVELLGSLGDDLTIVNAARVSYAKESTWVKQDDGLRLVKELKASDAGLINYLLREHHGTPFEMVQFRWRVGVPIGVAREWQRHRIGSFNEVSTRYVEMQPDFYNPPDDAWRKQVGKPGHYEMVPMDAEESTNAATIMRLSYESSYESYKFLLHLGVAKELARNVLPLGLMTEFYWSVNLRSLFNFVALRTAPTALLEIRKEAQEIERLATAIVPEAFAAFNANGRVAP